LSLVTYWMVCLSVPSAALVLLAIFSMLAMAQRQDEAQDRLEIELRRGSTFASHFDHERNLIRSGSLLPLNLLNR
jgi:hypothetical protein